MNPIIRLPLFAALCATTVLAHTAAQPSAASPETRPPNAAFKPAVAGQTRAPALRTAAELDVVSIVKGLQQPWSFELLPDGRYLIAERPGRLRIAAADGTLGEPLDGIPAVAFDGQGGLLDVALDPQFAMNHRIFWTFAEPRDGGNGTSLASAVLVEDAGNAKLDDVRVLFRQMPTLQSRLHFGSRIVFTADGQQLYLTLGERGVPEGRVQAQDLGSHFGKVLRLNLDGAPAAGNPFAGRAGAKPEIWSYGHRNIQAAALDPRGRLWTIEHGPRGGDELNRPEAGKNYGWPIIGYGIDYPGTKMHDASAREGLEQPVYYWDPVIAPSGMVFHSGAGAAEWQGDIFVGGLGSAKLVRLKLDGDRVIGEEWLLADRGLRVRDVKEAPGGALLVLAENGELLKVTPKS